MTSPNPYAATAADLNQPQLVGELATLGQRFGASFIDGLIAIVLAVPFWAMTGFFEVLSHGGQVDYFFAVKGMAWGLASFLLVHTYFLHKNGQTIGKKLLKIAIVTTDGAKPSLLTLLVKRYLPVFLIRLVPFVGNLLGLVDVCFIFREDRRCLHDLIAGTKVIKSA
ncbi:Uncharacterized membrane protein YckC, RDD family [Andreprevotia lacus DSM 23236]|jgi:uncharacterized RDD family membrane protein YckC|uniref:Uncharacterized membrane protein YckC, RDD family n=2 Tax=Andreprevotia TaxID=397275 RepID=A0A1W1XE77_9NEIS|nr:Uncharacterized membrane protein YckC, RDD family [Andreprevotia lacus DSM 23236]